jgi:hypothetical protein
MFSSIYFDLTPVSDILSSASLVALVSNFNFFLRKSGNGNESIALLINDLILSTRLLKKSPIDENIPVTEFLIVLNAPVKRSLIACILFLAFSIA